MDRIHYCNSQKDNQHCGFGTTLLEEVMHRCRQGNHKGIYLEVAANNTLAIIFYSKIGFTFQRFDRDKISPSMDVSIYGLVNRFRACRPGMIESPPQYYFCYDVVAEEAHELGIISASSSDKQNKKGKSECNIQ